MSTTSNAHPMDHRLQLPLAPLPLTADSLRETVREAAAWGTELGLRYPTPSLSLSLPLVLDPELEDAACAELEAARGVLLAAAEERFEKYWSDRLAGSFAIHLDEAFTAGFRDVIRLEDPPSDVFSSDWFAALVEEQLGNLVAEIASRGYPVPGGSAVLASEDIAARTPTTWDFDDESIEGRSEWIADPGEGRIRQWWMEGDRVGVRVGSRFAGSRNRQELLWIRRDEIPVLVAMLEAARSFVD